MDVWIAVLIRLFEGWQGVGRYRTPLPLSKQKEERGMISNYFSFKECQVHRY